MQEQVQRGGSNAATAEERRAFVRYPCALEVNCQDANSEDDRWWNARIGDISVGGLGMVLNRPFETGTVLEVDFQAPGGEWRRQQARVVHVQQRGNEWHVGCEFVERIGDDALADLLLQATAGFEEA